MNRPDALSPDKLDQAGMIFRDVALVLRAQATRIDQLVTEIDLIISEAAHPLRTGVMHPLSDALPRSHRRKAPRKPEREAAELSTWNPPDIQEKSLSDLCQELIESQPGLTQAELEQCLVQRRRATKKKAVKDLLYRKVKVRKTLECRDGRYYPTNSQS